MYKSGTLQYFSKFVETSSVKAFIKTVSYHLPEKTFSNDDFFRAFPEEINHRDNLLKTGVETRHIVSENETASDLGVQAAEKLFREHNIDPASIGFLLFCAQEFDHYTPTTACIMHERLGLPKHAGALDFNLGCSGYVYGLSLAKGLIESTGVENVLLVTSSTLTKTFHKKDKSSIFVFGDGAAATLISSRGTEGIGKFIFGTDGKGKDKIIVKDGGARNKISETSYLENTDEYGNTTSDGNFYMHGTGVFIFGLRTVPGIIADVLGKENLTTHDIDLFIFHQANLFLIDAIRTKIDVPEDKVFNYIRTVGNTVSSSIPIALAEAIKAGKAKPGDRILLTGFGVGLSWAATIIRL
jgi:3-oxoacyl-[acyl-carrier-protein] synthase-3